MAHKQPKVSYTNFCMAFAGVFKKYAHNQATYHTCYIRGAIDDYIGCAPDRRAILMEDAYREDLVGYRIAAQLLRCGWPEDAITDYATQQQCYVDDMEDHSIFLDVLHHAGYANEAGFARASNGVRYAWLLDGAPNLQETMDEMDSEVEDDD